MPVNIFIAVCRQNLSTQQHNIIWRLSIDSKSSFTYIRWGYFCFTSYIRLRSKVILSKIIKLYLNKQSNMLILLQKVEFSLALTFDNRKCIGENLMWSKFLISSSISAVWPPTVYSKIMQYRMIFTVFLITRSKDHHCWNCSHFRFLCWLRIPPAQNCKYTYNTCCYNYNHL